MKKAKVNNTVVGSVSIYGTSGVGYGYLAYLTDWTKAGGDGEVKASRMATDVLWRGIEDIRSALRGHHVIGDRPVPPEPTGIVEIHIDTDAGPKVARIDLEKATPYFGDLEWKAAPVYVISCEEILKHAEPPVA